MIVRTCHKRKSLMRASPLVLTNRSGSGEYLVSKHFDISDSDKSLKKMHYEDSNCINITDSVSIRPFSMPSLIALTARVISSCAVYAKHTLINALQVPSIAQAAVVCI